MAAERARRRAGRVEKDGVIFPLRFPVERICGDELGVQMRALEIFAESFEATFGRVHRRHAMPGGGELHRLPTRRGAEVEDVGTGIRNQAGGQ